MRMRLWIALAASFLCVEAASAQLVAWSSVGKDTEDNEWFVDTNSVFTRKGETLFVGRVQRTGRADGARFDEQVSQFSLVCSGDSYRTTSVWRYLSGEIVSTDDAERESRSVPPGSMMAAMKERVCEIARKQKQPPRLFADDDGDTYDLVLVDWSGAQFSAAVIVTYASPKNDAASGRQIASAGWFLLGNCANGQLGTDKVWRYDAEGKRIREDNDGTPLRTPEPRTVGFGLLRDLCGIRGYRVAANGQARPPAQQAQAAPPVQRAAAAPARRASSGSGFFVSPEGHLLTNHHVIDACSRVQVTTSEGRKHPANVAAIDSKNDLALLRVDAQATAFVSFRPTPIRAGESVIAMGYPLRGLLASEANVSTGTVSALAGLHNDVSKMQIQAPVQPGNSGGPLFDMTGAVVGVVLEKLDALAVAKATGDVPQNVNFGVKIEIVRLLLQTAGVEPRNSPAAAPVLSAPAVAQRGRPMTALVECVP
jgi:S1-C subfamily serine protease